MSSVNRDTTSNGHTAAGGSGSELKNGDSIQPEQSTSTSTTTSGFTTDQAKALETFKQAAGAGNAGETFQLAPNVFEEYKASVKDGAAGRACEEGDTAANGSDSHNPSNVGLQIDPNASRLGTSLP